MKKNNEIDYSDWLSENLDRTIEYTEHVASEIVDFSCYDGGGGYDTMSEKHYQRKIKILKLFNSFKDEEIEELKNKLAKYEG